MNGIHGNKQVTLPYKPVKNLYIFTLLMVLQTLLACRSLPSTPDWYNKRSLTEGIIIGYGMGKSIQQAKQIAYRSITQQIEINVTSQTAFIKRTHNDLSSIKTREVTQLKTSRTLKNVQTIHQEQIGDRYLVALEYDQRPLQQILSSKLENLGFQQRTFSGSSVITQSKLLHSLNTKSGDTLPATLQRKDKQWYLSIGKLIHPIDDLDAITNWKFKESSALRINLNEKIENRLKAGETFQLSIDIQKDINYITVFNIYSDGRVVTLLDNKSVTSTNILFPHPHSQNQLVATAVNPQLTDRDLYLAIGTKDKIETTLFRKTTDNKVTGEDSYNLHKFIDWLSQQPTLSISPLFVEIVP